MEKVRKRSIGHYLVFALLALPCLIIGGCVVMMGTVLRDYMFGPTPPAMALASISTQDVVGNLNGMPIKIPRHMAEDVEYVGDPGWGERRKGPVPERTYDSALKSFGVTFRYPDMATLSSIELRDDKRKKSIFSTDWIMFGVSSPSLIDFPERYYRYKMEPNSVSQGTYYQPMQGKKFGLTGYLLVRKATGLPPDPMPTVVEDTLYVAYSKNGSFKAMINCSTVQHAAAPCRHGFNLAQAGGPSVYVYARYRIGMLPHWEDIQEKITQMILGFKLSPV
ncbi:hypothetical protein NQT62_11690 [Limnobacter humi]|uniref:Uncharacterized protein n=1 Tax=Limnobacter humi TaxID=1778671 RepID=A0ABT1WJ82_9BURK|nr:hypothetical protein [Limnobacter humi]MCQ8897096.1 hypothetical protein [Limnobacter humi]